MKLVPVALSMLLLAAALVIAQWNRSENPPTDTGRTAREGSEASGSSRSVAAEAAADAESPPTPTPARPASTVQQRPATLRTAEDLGAIAEGIDPQLRNRLLLSPRRPNTGEGPNFIEMESQFGTETADANWSGAAEARILGRIAQIANLELVSLNAECRATICRVKLFHPPGTKVRSSLDTLKLPADEMGFGHAEEVATLGDDGVPISVLYFRRKGV
jgi:hypothetical protein